MEIPNVLLPYLNRPVAVFGGGVSGLAVSQLLRSLSVPYSIFDEAHGDAFSLRNAEHIGLVIYSPGFRKDHPWMQAARQAGCLCLVELDFAAAFWKGSIVAITGTNGKSTLTEFITTSYNEAGMHAVAAGNIGNPLSNFVMLPRASARIAVVEVSSFQAEEMQFFKPSALLWTNFSEDHLDRYDTLKDYFVAKWHLVEALKDLKLFVGPSVKAYAEQFGYKLPAFAQVVDFSNAADMALAQSIFAQRPQLENYLLAKHYWQAEHLPMDALIQGAFHLPQSPHRLREIRKINGISFWNDSKATNFASALSAIDSFDKRVIWIGGGFSKKGDIENFGRTVASKIKAAFLMGDTAATLERVMAATCQVEVCEGLAEAVERAFAFAQAGDIVLLAPGFASFRLFKNYAERGNFFIKTVLSLNPKP